MGFLGLDTNYNQQAGFTVSEVPVSEVHGILFSDTAAANLMEGLLGPYPVRPYSVTCKMTVPFPKVVYGGAGLAIVDTLTGKAMWFGMLYYGSSWTMTVETFSNPSTYGTNLLFSSTGVNQASEWTFLRLADDGTNITFSFSNDGVFFTQAYTVAKSSSYLGGSGFNYLGFVIVPNTTHVGTLVTDFELVTS